jgi:hypothetical protein
MRVHHGASTERTRRASLSAAQRAEKKFRGRKKILHRYAVSVLFLCQKQLLIMIRSTSHILDAHIKEAKRTAMISSPSLFL